MGKVIEIKMGDKVYTEAIEDNISLSEMSPETVINALNRAVGKYAFYATLRADAKRILAMTETDFKAWEAQKYSDIQKLPDYVKATGKTIDTQVILQNEREWRTWQKKITKVSSLCDKLWLLIQSFELMTKTLQSVLAMQRAELTSAGQQGFARGSGDLLTD